MSDTPAIRADGLDIAAYPDKAEWFQATAIEGGVDITFGLDPLAYIWQTPEQIREIIGKLELALITAEKPTESIA